MFAVPTIEAPKDIRRRECSPPGHVAPRLFVSVDDRLTGGDVRGEGPATVTACRAGARFPAVRHPTWEAVRDTEKGRCRARRQARRASGGPVPAPG